MNEPLELRASRDTRPLLRRCADLTLVGCGLFVGFTVLMHLLYPALDPLRHTLSEYAIQSPLGQLLSLALLCLGAGSFILARVLQLSLTYSHWMRLGLNLLTIWSIGVVAAASFPTEANGIPVSLDGIIHGISASIAFFGIGVAELCLSIHFRRESNRHTVSAPALILAIISCALLGSLGLPDSVRGGGERIFVGVVVAWLCFIGLRLRRLTQVLSVHPQNSSEVHQRY
jgi:hypothetical protein